MPVELRYDRFSSPDAKGGPKLVVLHGLFGSRRNWRGAAKALAASGEKRGQGLTLFTVDLRHHGESPNRGPFSLEALAQDVCAFIEGPAIGGGPVTLLGHSLGGKVALQVLRQCPEVIERLVLADITPFRLSEEMCGGLRRVVAALQELQSSPAALESRGAAEDLLGRRLESPELVRFLMHNLRRGDDRRLFLQLGIDAIAAGFDEACRSVLPQTGPERGLDSENAGEAAPAAAWRETPLLTIRGEKSEYMPPEHFEALTSWFRMHTNITIKNAGHWLHVERQEEFVKAVMEGLDI